MKPQRNVRRIASVAIAVVALWAAGPRAARADDTTPAASPVKIGFVDSGKIFDQYEGAKDAQRTLERESKDWEAKAQKMKDSLQTSADELESQRLMLSQDTLKRREDDVAALKKTYEDYVSSIWGDSGKLSQRNQELTKPIIDKVNAILHTIAEQDGYTLVLDAAGGTIVYASPAIDLTDRVLAELNKEGETGKETPKK